MTREEYFEEIKNYLQEKCKEETDVESALKEREFWVYSYFDNLDEYDGDIYLALEDAKADLLLVVNKLNKEEFTEEVIRRLSKMENTSEDKIKEIVELDKYIVDNNFNKANVSGDFYHSICSAVNDYYYSYIY